VPGFEATNFRGVGAPRNTPVEIIDKLNREINAALADPRMKARLANLGGTVLAGSPGDFGKLIADETEKLAKVVKFCGAKPDRSASRTVCQKQGPRRRGNTLVVWCVKAAGIEGE
jgi:hypothetical protein